MSSDQRERRNTSNQTAIVDEAVFLAHELGWRYPLAYLISERVPSEIIQRLMFGGEAARREECTRSR